MPLAWNGNRELLDETRAIIDEAHEATAGEGVEPLAPGVIEKLRAQTMKLEDYDGLPPVSLSMGMYQDEVYEPVRAAYLDVLRRRVMQQIVNADAAEMEAFGRRFESGARPDAQEMRAMYNRLKLHLLLTLPRDENTAEPTSLDEDLSGFVRSALVTRWKDATETRRADPGYAQIQQNVDYYVRSMAGHPELYFARNPSAVGRVRGVFNAVGGFDMAIEGIIEEVRPRGADMTLQRMLGRDVTTLTSRERVRFAFTRDGYERYVRDMLDTDAARFFGEPWVLGHPPPEDERRAEQERVCQVEALKSYYLNRYVQEWQRFIDSVEVSVPHTDDESLMQLAQLTGGDPMRITMLVRQIDREVTLDTPGGGGGAGSAAAGAAAREAERAAQKRLSKRLGQGNAGRLMRAGQADAQRRLSRSCPPLANQLTPSGVRARFAGFLDFAPPPQRDLPDGQTAQVTPARTYEEQLEFLRDAMQFRIAGTNVTDWATRQAEARTVTERLIRERPPEWQVRFGTLLRPPVEGPVPLAPAIPVAPAVPVAPVPGAAAPAPAPAPSAAPAPAPAPARAPRPRPRPTPQPFQPVVRPL